MDAQRTGAASMSDATDTPALNPADLALIDQALAELDQFPGRSPVISALVGGLTNRNYRVSFAGASDVVARISSDRSSVLTIDRDAECHNASAAASIGVGPRVIGCFPDRGVSLVEWIDGRTLAADDLDDSAELLRLAQLCRQLHAGPRFANDFNMFAVQREYLAIVEQNGFRIPPGYADYSDRLDEIQGALLTCSLETVPCHNDLLAANIMDTGDRLWLIDYEYSGNNDPTFELGNLWAEAELGVDRLAELVTNYFGAHSPAKIARARLFAMAACYGWTLWAAIQQAVSTIAFDFWSWGLEKYERAVAEFKGPEVSHLIEDVQRSN